MNIVQGIIVPTLCLAALCNCSKKNPTEIQHPEEGTAIYGTVLCNGFPVSDASIRVQYNFSPVKSCSLEYTYPVLGYRGPIICWRVSNQVNTYQWEVSRSLRSDSIIFSPIGYMPGMGTNPQSDFYQYYDNTLPGRTMGFYRVGEIDSLGCVTHFKPIPFIYESITFTDVKGRFKFTKMLVDSIYPMPDSLGNVSDSVKVSPAVTLYIVKNGYVPLDTGAILQKDSDNNLLFVIESN